MASSFQFNEVQSEQHSTGFFWGDPWLVAFGQVFGLLVGTQFPKGRYGDNGAVLHRVFVDGPG